VTKRSRHTILLTALGAALPAAAAEAHVSIASGPGFANVTQEITFGVGHGCAGADTYKVRIQIPAGVTSVRPLRSDFGKVAVEKDAAGTITAVVWQKADTEALDADIAFYKLVVRLKVPDAPWKPLYFPAEQTCRTATGALSVTNWSSLPTSAPVDGGEDEPAPTLQVLPARRPGWNKYVVGQPVSDLASLFSDALIVWKGTAAYSANPATVDLIKTTSGVTALSSLAANDEIWVKY
jgi:periplasmic copper chaperone A